jgi:type I restriction enzyme S subunit
MTTSPIWANWLPDKWTVKSFKVVGKYLTSNVDKISNKNELPVRLCNYTDVYKNDFITLNMSFMEATATIEEIERFRIHIGDVIITKDSESWDDIAIPALVTEEADDLVCGYHLAILRANPSHLDGRFLFRCVQSKLLRRYLELESKGVTRFGLGQDAIGRFPLPLPPLPTQRRIADFLDRETAQIDALIKAKEQMLTLLQEKRAAQISQMVTKGLDPNVEMKDSGLEWLGQVPTHWKIMQLKRLFESSDYGISVDIRGEGPIKVLRMSCIVDGKVDLDSAGAVENVDSYLLIRKNDVLFNRTNSLDQVAKVGLVDREPDHLTTFASYLVRLRFTEEVNLQYIVGLLNSSSFLKYSRANAIASISQANLNPTRYGDTLIIVPPLQEQEAIGREIAIQEQEYQHITGKLAISISLLHERRSALITAAVTGQIPEVVG